MLAGAIAEVLTLGAVLPFLSVIADPASVMAYPSVTLVMEWLGLNGRDDLLLALTSLFAVTAIGAAAVRLALVWATNKYVFLVGYDLGTRLYERMLYQPYVFHASQNTSEVVASLQKVQQVTFNVLLPLMHGVSSVFIGLFIVAALLCVDVAASAAAFAGFGLIYLGVWLFSRSRLRANGRIIARVQSARVQTLQEGLGGIRDVLLDGNQPVFLEKFADLDRQFRDAQATNNLIAAAPRFVVEACGMVLIAFLALVLSRGAGGIAATLPVLGALALGAQRLVPLMQQIYGGSSAIAAYGRTAEDVLDMAEAAVPEEWMEAPSSPLPFERAITLRGVSFAYRGDERRAIRGLGVTIPKGARVGIVGPTGSGKSTLIDLLMGLLEPTEGAIEIDGRRLDAATRRAWRAQIAHVPQSIFLADASIAENIAFGIAPERIDLERVRQAAQQAAIAHHVESLPEGYATMVGERGIRLSGGQRQRIGIARALYKGASVLVLDEATSALDTQTEATVMAAVERLAADLTIVIIAHRTSTIAFCDQQIRLEGGRLVKSANIRASTPGRRSPSSLLRFDAEGRYATSVDSTE
ncbi:ATP-binding cassette domain-containing protein [Jiella sp. 40Bstr34]|uniref:ATP-binding cassette domain-containing protein n=2 Tax=Jiella pacifica TaxID=2696469 RepID=A0A6N9SZ55_9HYPH|nr:ATP-binding cassette domain-containing protein [Jiella pacifica]